LTTGEVAKLCSVAPRTVSKWFDSGQLRGYRIPGSKDRRIPVEQLVRFMRAHGIPLNGLDAGSTRVLILDGDARLCAIVRDGLEATESFDVSVAETALEAGAVARAHEPHVAVIDVSLPDVDVRSVVRFFRATDGLAHTRLIGVSMGMSDAAGQSLLQAGFDAYLAKPFDLSALVETIDRLTCSVVTPSVQER
jgi:excisionase family DNA binding protein